VRQAEGAGETGGIAKVRLAGLVIDAAHGGRLL
jgi:hypothetical protein